MGAHPSTPAGVMSREARTLLVQVLLIPVVAAAFLGPHLLVGLLAGGH